MEREKYTKEERLHIVLDLVYKLKNYEDINGNIIDHYLDIYSFIPPFKKICNEYIKQTDGILKEYSGFLPYDEANRIIEYKLPIYKPERSLFVFRVISKKHQHTTSMKD